MSEEEIVPIHLTPAQQRKASKGQTFQVSAEALHEQPNARAVVNRRTALRLRRAIKNRKGFRFNSKDVRFETPEGGAFSFKKLNRSIRKGFKKVGDYIGSTDKGSLLSDVVNYAIPATTGAIAGAAGTALSGGNPVAGVAASSVGSKLGSMLAGEINKKAGTGIDTDKVIKLAMDEARSYTGSGVRPKLVKGSQAAKDHMAKLRAMRKSKSGSGVLDNVVKSMKGRARKIMAEAGQLAKEAAKDVAAEAKQEVVSQAKAVGRTVKSAAKSYGKTVLNSAVNAGAVSLASSNPALAPVAFVAADQINRRVNKKIRGLGVGVSAAYNQPVGGGGNAIRLALVRPDLLENKGLRQTKGGSFLPY